MPIANAEEVNRETATSARPAIVSIFQVFIQSTSDFADIMVFELFDSLLKQS